MCEGTGEASRAVEVALGTGLPDKRPLFEPGEDAIGTGRGRDDDGDPPSRGVDMVSHFFRRLQIAVVGQVRGLLSHLYHDWGEKQKWAVSWGQPQAF